MAQVRDFDFRAPEDTERLNIRLSQTVRAGVHKGFEVINGSASFITIKAGVLLTAEGVRIEETTDQADLLPIPANSSGNPRLDYIVLRYEYLKSVPAPIATYHIIQGTPAASPVLPAVLATDTILTSGQLDDGADAYINFVYAQADVLINATFDGEKYYIIEDFKAALRFEVNTTDGGYNIYIVPKDTLAPGAEIIWLSPQIEINENGIQQVIDEALTRLTDDGILQDNIDSEALTRLTNDGILQDNIDSEALTRLTNDGILQDNIDSEALTRGNADTALQNSLADAKGIAWNTNMPANENISELADRLDTLEAASGVPAHRSRHESGGDDVVRFDSLEDGTIYKKFLATERTALTSLSDGSEITTLHIHDTLYAPLTHVGATGAAHGNVTTGIAGFMSSSDKTKLNGIEALAEVNNISDAYAAILTGGGDSSVLHIHDVLYFTQAESNANFAAIGHDHSAGSPYSQVVAGGIADDAVTTAKFNPTIYENYLSGGYTVIPANGDTNVIELTNRPTGWYLLQSAFVVGVFVNDPRLRVRVDAIGTLTSFPMQLFTRLDDFDVSAMQLQISGLIHVTAATATITVYARVSGVATSAVTIQNRHLSMIRLTDS